MVKYDLLKKVNEPISFKGFRGMYLFYALGVLGACLLLTVIFFITISNKVILFSLLGIILIWALLLLNRFKTKSKGDYNIHHKKAANKKLTIKGVSINYNKLR